MRALLDTHVLIWWWDEQHRLPPGVIELIEKRENAIHVSAISALEIAIKVRLGQLPQMREKISMFDASVSADGFVHMPMTGHHGSLAGRLPGEHRDPFDRVLAAQAITHDLVVVTRDPEIAAFGCRTHW